MPEYVLIYDNKQSSDYGRILNMSNTIHSVRSLYTLMSTYWEMNALRTLAKI